MSEPIEQPFLQIVGDGPTPDGLRAAIELGMGADW